MTTQKNEQITRKDFLKSVGVSVAGAAMIGIMGSILTACTGDKNPQAANTQNTPNSNSAERPEWPFKYVRLDPEKVRARAFNAYKTKGG